MHDGDPEEFFFLIDTSPTRAPSLGTHVETLLYWLIVELGVSIDDLASCGHMAWMYWSCGGAYDALLG
jgi:hypothetical protein